MAATITRIGKIDDSFDSFILKSILIKNDAGDWGNDPDNNAIGIIRSTNFNNNGKLDLTDVAYRTLKPNKKVEKLLYSGEILIERSGGSDSQPVGRVGLITDEISKDEFAFANFIQRISIDDSIDSTYLFYCLQQMYEMGITATMQYQTTGIRNLDWKMYTKSLFPKPLKPEQTAIASILTKVDEAILATQNSIKAAEKLKKALMQNLLTGKLKPDGTWRTEDEFYMDEKFGFLPLGWERKQVKDLSAQIQYGLNTSSSENGEYPMFRMNNIIDGKIVAAPMAFVNLNEAEFNKYKLNKGDILFNRTNSLDLVGKIGIFELEGNYVFASYLIRIKANRENNPMYINYYLNSYRGQCSLRAKATPAVSQANINSKSLRNTFIPRPPKVEQDNIVKILNRLDIQKMTLRNKITTLQRLKKSLMQNLLTGKVRVDVENINKLLNL